VTIWTKSFWLAWAERVLATLIQAAIGFGTAWAQNDFSFKGWDWKNNLFAILVSAGTAALKGVLANLATKDGPSLTHAEQVEPDLPNVPQS
jgi:hypothetical protein